MTLAFAIVLCTLAHIAQCQTTAATGPGDAKNDSVRVIFEIPIEEDKSFSTENPLTDLAPKCKNFLRTAVVGRWLPKHPPSQSNWYQRKTFKVEQRQLRAKLERDMKFVWKKRGIPENPWPSSRTCGYYRQRHPVSSRWPSIGTWCDPKSSRPCCDNQLLGHCVPAEKGRCNCPMCADVRKLRHAELMEWQPYNSFWCKWRHYNAEEACDVIEHSPVRELYYVGDSYMQSMYLSLLMILTGKPISGSFKKEPFTPEMKSLCSNYGLTYFKDCRAMIQSMDEMRYRDSLCGDGRNVTFKAEFKKYYNTKYSKDFKNLVASLVGKPGTYVVVGIGFHVQMRLDIAIKNYMNPAMWQIRSYYKNKPEVPVNKRWPQVLFSFPMSYGLLKPTRYLKAQYITKQVKFEAGMRRYCQKNNIEVLDFTAMTKDVHSFDGIHYGVGVNVEKNQILLNYLATLK